MTISNVVKIATTTGGGGGGGGSSLCIVGGCGPGSADVINTTPVGSEYGLVTRVAGIVNVNVVSSIAAGVVTNTYGTVSLVPSNTLTTVVSYTVPVGFTFVVAGYAASGDCNATFTLFINGAPVLTATSTVAQLSVAPNFFGANPSVPAGQSVVLKVTQGNPGVLGNFTGTILGSNI